jgi:hypothetical protein
VRKSARASISRIRSRKWLALLFVDSDRVLSSILFKGESLDNFEELRRRYRLKGETLLSKTIRAQMAHAIQPEAWGNLLRGRV